MERTEPYTETHPHLAEFSTFLPELNKESDRGATLIATGFLDELLKQTLLAFFRDDKTGLALVDGFNAPLRTLSTRITAAAALTFISDHEQNEANTLRKIRYEFAHNVRVSFQDQRIKDLCGNLNLGIAGSTPRGLFTTSAVCLILNLTNRPTYVRKFKRTETSWPC